MNILCGTDFSAPAGIAARAAARLAAGLGAKLHLAHVAQLPGIRSGGAATVHDLSREEFERRRGMLHQQASELRGLGAEVVEHLVEGVPDEELERVTRELGAELVVIAPIGDRRPSLWSLGGVAMRVIKSASVPTLVVREDASVEAWMKGGRTLRVLLGVEPKTPLAAARATLERFAGARPVEVVAGHVYARGERRESPRERYEEELRDALRKRVGKVAGAAPRLHVLAGWGRVAEHLLELAAQEAADLVVVGTHRRAGVDRLVHGSVSLDLVGASARNVLTVPILPSSAQSRPVQREFKRVLVPVDLSEFSPRAVEHAAALLPRGGVLQLLHVATPYVPASLDYGAFVSVPPPSAEETARLAAEIQSKMLALAPQDAAARQLEVQVEVVSAFNAVEQVCAAAQRLGSDAICIPTHGRSGISKLVLGSVAEGVIRHAAVPVLVVPPHAP
jgi:nucleotide-binding universal stress UspA family protein